MKVRILYFAALRESLGIASEDFQLPDGVGDVAGVRACLASRGGHWEKLSARSVKAAVNQTMASGESPVRPGDEVAFFPPVTGG